MHYKQKFRIFYIFHPFCNVRRLRSLLFTAFFCSFLKSFLFFLLSELIKNIYHRRNISFSIQSFKMALQKKINRTPFFHLRSTLDELILRIPFTYCLNLKPIKIHRLAVSNFSLFIFFIPLLFIRHQFHPYANRVTNASSPF